MRQRWSRPLDAARALFLRTLTPAGTADTDVAAQFRIINLIVVTLLAWGALIAIFGGFSHVDALRAGRESALGARLAAYGFGFAPWLVLGPAVFLLSRRYADRKKSFAVELAIAATCFAAAFGVIFLYFIAIYAPLSGMTASEAVASTRLVDWAPDIFIFLIAYLAGQERSGAAARIESGAPPRVAVRSQGRVDYVVIDEISGGSACGNYVAIYAGDREYLYRGAIKTLSAELAPYGLIRVHRSHFVRPECVTSAKFTGGRIRELILVNGESIPVSAPFEARVRASLSESAIGAAGKGKRR